MPDTTAGQGNGYKPRIINPLQLRAGRIIKRIASPEDKFVADHRDLVELIEILRQMGAIIVFVTGVWDMIHNGHGRYLAKGKEAACKLYPDAELVILVVGLDTDELTKQRKGESRPIVPEEERWEMIGFLASPDIVTLQYEHDQLFRIVPHDVRVISESTKDIPPELDMEIRSQCEHLVNLPPQAETSTTARIRRLIMDGGKDVLNRMQQGLQTLMKEVEDAISKY